MVDLPYNDRRVRYVVTNPLGQAEFDIDFPLDNVDYIQVYKDGDGVLSTDFTVDLEDLKVTLDTNAPQGAVVTLEGLQLPERDTTYPLRGGLKSPLLNAEFRKIFTMMQEMRRDITRTINLNKAEGDDVSASLPLKVPGRAVVWGEDGLENSESDIASLDSVVSQVTTIRNEVSDLRDEAAASESGAGDAATASGAARDEAVAARDAAQASVGGVKATAADTTPGSLEAKLLVAGSPLSLSTQNPGANETRTITLAVADLSQTIAGAANKAVLAEHLPGAVAALAPAGGIPNSGYRTGYYYGGLSEIDNLAAVTSGRLMVAPFFVSEEATFDRLGFVVTGSAAGNTRFGIYDFVDGLPTNLILDSGTIAVSGTGSIVATISQLLPAGVYGVASLFSATPQVVTGKMDGGLAEHVWGAAANGGSGPSYAYYSTYAFAALPSVFPALTAAASANSVPRMVMRKS